MKQSILVSILLALSLAGCKKELSCSSPETQSLFVNSFNSELINYNNSNTPLTESNIKISLSDIQTISSDKQSTSQLCKAEMKVDVGTPISGSLLELLLNNKISIDDALYRQVLNNYFLANINSQNGISNLFSMIGAAIGSEFTLSQFKATTNINPKGYSANVYYDINLSQDSNVQSLTIKNPDSVIYPTIIMESLNFTKSTTTLAGKITVEGDRGQDDSEHYPGYFLHLPHQNWEDGYFIGLYGDKSSESKINIIKKAGCKIYGEEYLNSDSFTLDTPDCSVEAVGSPNDNITITQIISAKKLN